MGDGMDIQVVLVCRCRVVKATVYIYIYTHISSETIVNHNRVNLITS